MTGPLARDATVTLILEHFASLTRRAAGWHAPDFIGLEVTMSQAKCLYVVGLHPGISLSAVAEQLGVGLSAASGLVDRLVEHGYLRRQEDPADRRQHQLQVTDAGAAAIDTVREINTNFFRALLAGLANEELDALCVGLAALDARAHTIDAPDFAAIVRAAEPRHERTLG